MKANIKKLYSIIGLIIFLLVALQLFLSNKLTFEGQKINSVQLQISILEEENNRLKNDIASLGGLNTLKKIAEEKNYIEKPPVVNLTDKIPLAIHTK